MKKKTLRTLNVNKLSYTKIDFQGCTAKKKKNITDSVNIDFVIFPVLAGFYES